MVSFYCYYHGYCVCVIKSYEVNCSSFTFTTTRVQVVIRIKRCGSRIKQCIAAIKMELLWW